MRACSQTAALCADALYLPQPTHTHSPPPSLPCSYTVLFAFEEAIGFMMGQLEADKDGISAAAVFGELAGGCRRGVVEEGGQ